MSGTNIGTGNLVPADQLKARGYTKVRLVSLPSAESYAATLRAIGIWVLAIVIPAQDQGYVMSNADVYQMDNERDIDMSPANYRAQAVFYQETYPDLFWISCGMAAGNPAWLKGVQDAGGLPGFGGFAVHPYNKTPDEALQLIKQYRSAAPILTKNMDCWITEWTRPHNQVPRMQLMLKLNVVQDFWFCEDCGVPGYAHPPLIFKAD